MPTESDQEQNSAANSIQVDGGLSSIVESPEPQSAIRHLSHPQNDEWKRAQSQILRQSSQVSKISRIMEAQDKAITEVNSEYSDSDVDREAIVEER